MAIYWPTPGLKGRTFKLCVLTKWDFNFCIRSSPLRGNKGERAREKEREREREIGVVRKPSKKLQALNFSHKDGFTNFTDFLSLKKGEELRTALFAHVSNHKACSPVKVKNKAITGVNSAWQCPGQSASRTVTVALMPLFGSLNEWEENLFVSWCF